MPSKQTNSLTHRRRQKLLWFAALAGLVIVVTTILVTIFRKPSPRTTKVSRCGNLAPGLRRIGDPSGFQFDVPLNRFSIREGGTDAPPLIHGFGIRPNGGKSELEISFPHRPMPSMAIDPIRTLSTHVEQRPVLNHESKPVGEDHRGYIQSGERWRQLLLFKGGMVAKYGLVPDKDAAAFDQVIDSVCISSERVTGNSPEK